MKGVQSTNTNLDVVQDAYSHCLLTSFKLRHHLKLHFSTEPGRKRTKYAYSHRSKSASSVAIVCITGSLEAVKLNSISVCPSLHCGHGGVIVEEFSF